MSTEQPDICFVMMDLRPTVNKQHVFLDALERKLGATSESFYMQKPERPRQSLDRTFLVKWYYLKVEETAMLTLRNKASMDEWTGKKH